MTTKRRPDPPNGNPTLKCYGPDCEVKLPLYRRDRSEFWRSGRASFGFKGNNYFCSMTCATEWAVIKCDAGSDHEP